MKSADYQPARGHNDGLSAEQADRQAEALLQGLFDLSSQADHRKYYAAAESGWYALHRRSAARRPGHFPDLDIKYALRRDRLRKQEGLSYGDATEVVIREYIAELESLNVAPSSRAMVRLWIERVAGAKEKLEGIVDGLDPGVRA